MKKKFLWCFITSDFHYQLPIKTIFTSWLVHYHKSSKEFAGHTDKRHHTLESCDTCPARFHILTVLSRTRAAKIKTLHALMLHLDNLRRSRQAEFVWWWIVMQRFEEWCCPCVRLWCGLWRVMLKSDVWGLTPLMEQAPASHANFKTLLWVSRFQMHFSHFPLKSA